MVLETDAPDMSGIAHRYQRNSPAYLPEAAAVLADLRNLPISEVARISTQNAFSVLVEEAS